MWKDNGNANPQSMNRAQKRAMERFFAREVKVNPWKGEPVLSHWKRGLKPCVMGF